jgi:diaminopimelate decarboxylase
MWSRYNSRQIPKVIGYTNDGEQFEILRERETPEQAASFWE